MKSGILALHPQIERGPASFSYRLGQRPITSPGGEEASSPGEREKILRRNERVFRRFVAGSLLAAALVLLAILLGWRA